MSCLDRVLRSAAHLIGKLQRYDHVTRYKFDVLNWLPVRQRTEHRVVSLVWQCQLGLEPAYLIDLCQTVSVPCIADPFALLRGVLLVSFARTAAMQNRTFSVAGPWIWKGLPQELCLFPSYVPIQFSLKNMPFLSALELGLLLCSCLEGVLYKSLNE